MSNLSNVYAYLRDKYIDLSMQFGKCPTFIKTLTGIDSRQKIIFIYKEDVLKFNVKKEFQSPLSDVDKSETNIFNSTAQDNFGSPLRDDNSINEIINTSVASKMCARNPWKEVEESYIPIHINLADEILNDISNYDFPKNSVGWIFVLCDNDESKNPTFLLSLNVAKNKFKRGIAKYHGVIKNGDRLMSTYLKKQTTMLPRAKPEINIESTYEINPDVSLKFMNSMVAYDCSLSHINPMSQVLLYQKVEIGKSHQLCEQLWNQIQLLYMIKNDIVNAKNNSCDGTLMEPSYNYGSMNYDDLQKKVNEILSDVVSYSENYEEAVDTSLEAVIKKAYNRPLLEITDQLWEILKFASSHSDLRKILTFIFQISSRSSIVNIPMNNNRLAELIREISQHRLAIPHLASTQPMELLLEIGLEKVMKDYEFIFAESKVCILSDINIGQTKVTSQMDGNMNVRKSLAVHAMDANQAMNRKTLLHGAANNKNDDMDDIKNSRFNDKEAEIIISKMAKLHLAIEHILMMQNNLNLNNDYTQIARKVLEDPLVPFDDFQAERYDKLQIPINDKKVIHIVENLVPNSQKVTIKSENKFRAVENVFYFNMEQIVPSLMPKDDDGNIPDKGRDTFHFISYMNIASKY